jgi:PBP1b-binding outer membrane lipoprotein LpoB
MKRIILSISALAFLLTSCSNDEGTPMEPMATSELKLVTTSNTTGKVSYVDLIKTPTTTKSLTVNGLDADGAYFNSETDEFMLASRTNNTLQLYKGLNSSVSNNTDALLLQSSTGNTDFNNPREIAVSGDKVIVTQDQNATNGNTNKLIVYQKTSSGFTLLNSYTVNFKTWGIHIEGTTLYAVADSSSDLVVFENFFSNPNGSILPTKRVTIEGLVRTHGITFSAADNRMILTDVGSAASDSDGGIIIINDFTSRIAATANLGTITMSNQVRIYGASSTLGNPVDVAYDSVTKNIYIAERLNAGGKVLTFALPTRSGDATPLNSRTEAGVSSVYLIRK